MEKIIIKNLHNENLVGILHSTKKTKKLVIVCHGRLCTKDQHFIPYLCSEICRNGFNAFRFDFSGNGESEGLFEKSTITKEIFDIKSVANFFIEKGYEFYTLIGHSKGAVDVLVFQSKYNLAKKIVDISGLVDQKYETSKKYTKTQIAKLKVNGFFNIRSNNQNFKISKEYFYDRLKYGDIRKFVKKIKVPSLVLHGVIDNDTKVENSNIMIKNLNNLSKLTLISGAGHFFQGKRCRQELTNSIIKWLKDE